MLTYAVIGLGRRIAGVLNCFQTAAGARARMIGWSDPAPTGLEGLQKSGIPGGQGYDDPRRMIAELKPDVVVVGSPNHLHLEHIRLGLEAGCTVFTEKPVVITVEDTMALAALIARHGAHRLHVGLVLRSSPLFTAVNRLVREGRIGKLVSFEANEHLGPEHGGFLMRDWRRYRRYAGSYLLEKCCHDFDLYNAVVGRRASRVASFGGRDIFVPANAALAEGPSGGDKPRYHAWPVRWNSDEKVFDSDADTIDNQVAMVQYEGGARLAFHSNTHAPVGQRRWLLTGTHGMVESDFATGRIRFQPVFGASEDLSLDGKDGGHYGADEQQGRNLAATLLDGAPFPVPAVASLEAGLVCMAIDLAQREGRLVDLAPWWKQLDAVLAGGAKAAAAAR